MNTFLDSSGEFVRLHFFFVACHHVQKLEVEKVTTTIMLMTM